MNDRNINANIKKLFKKLSKAQSNLNGLEGDMAALIQPFIDVQNISIFWQPGDGFVICDDDSNNVPLDKCLHIIIRKGKLTEEEYNDLRI